MQATFDFFSSFKQLSTEGVWNEKAFCLFVYEGARQLRQILQNVPKYFNTSQV